MQLVGAGCVIVYSSFWATTLKADRSLQEKADCQQLIIPNYKFESFDGQFIRMFFIFLLISNVYLSKADLTVFFRDLMIIIVIYCHCLHTYPMSGLTIIEKLKSLFRFKKLAVNEG